MKASIILWTKRLLLGLVAITLLVTISLFSFIYLQARWMAQFSRTVEAPLKVDLENGVLTQAHSLLRALNAPTSNNSLRFAVMPSFGPRWFAISLSKHNDAVRGRVLTYNVETEAFVRRDFEMTTREMDAFLKEWDQIADGYAGDPRGITDGSPLAFERKRGSRYTSGNGNSPCHYNVLGDIAARRLGPYEPALSDLREADLKRLLDSDFCKTSLFEF